MGKKLELEQIRGLGQSGIKILGSLGQNPPKDFVGFPRAENFWTFMGQLRKFGPAKIGFQNQIGETNTTKELIF